MGAQSYFGAATSSNAATKLLARFVSSGLLASISMQLKPVPSMQRPQPHTPLTFGAFAAGACGKPVIPGASRIASAIAKLQTRSVRFTIRNPFDRYSKSSAVRYSDGSIKVNRLDDLVVSHFEFGGSLQRSEEHTSELQSQSNLVCRLLLEKKNTRET